MEVAQPISDWANQDTDGRIRDQLQMRVPNQPGAITVERSGTMGETWQREFGGQQQSHNDP